MLVILIWDIIKNFNDSHIEQDLPVVDEKKEDK